MNDWQDSERRDEKEAALYYTTHRCSLSSFTTQQLREELCNRNMNEDFIKNVQNALKEVDTWPKWKLDNLRAWYYRATEEDTK